MKERIKVLVVDDAIVVRILVGNTISKDPDLEFLGKAENGKIALEKIVELKPDVVVLDIEMPEMDGLTVLRNLRARNIQTKVIMFSTYTTVGATYTFEALELGAADFVPKPSSAGFSEGFEKVKEELLAKIKFVGSADTSQPIPKIVRTGTARISSNSSNYELIFFEGGMGAPKTFLDIIPDIPQNLSPSILIFQAMFSGFTEQFVRKLSKNAQIEIKAAQDSATLSPGQGSVLFGDYYAAVKRFGASLQLAFRGKDETEKYGSIPRILCESIAKICGKNAIGIILAGAGEGNLDGIQAIKDQGGIIITETPSTSIGRQVLNQLVDRKLVDDIVATKDLVPTLKKTLGLSK